MLLIWGGPERKPRLARRPGARRSRGATEPTDEQRVRTRDRGESGASLVDQVLPRLDQQSNPPSSVRSVVPRLDLCSGPSPRRRPAWMQGLTRPGRSDQTSHPGSTRHWGGIGEGPVRTLRHDATGHLQAPSGAGACRAHRAGPAGAVAAATASGGTAQGRRGLGRPVPTPLARELRASRRIPPTGPGGPTTARSSYRR